MPAQLAELGLLSASLLHELRQPVFAVKGSLQLARHRGQTLGPDEIDALLVHLAHLEQLIHHYSGFPRPDEPVTQFDLNVPIRHAIGMLAHRGRQLGAQLETRLSDRALLVEGRPTAARQVAVNLLQNAFDAVSETQRREVVVRSSAGSGQVRLVVQDTGPGVPEHLRARLFEPFVTTKPAGKGTGLGLFIARRLGCEANGAMQIHFPDEGGTRVEVELPAAA